MHHRRRLWLWLLLALFISLTVEVPYDWLTVEVPYSWLKGSISLADDTPPPPSVWIIGDSITRGLYASSETTMFRHRIFTSLQERYAGQIRLLYWEGMCTVARLEGRWSRLQQLPPPTILFIELGVNEVLPSATCEQLPVEEWQAHYGVMLSRFQQFAPDAKIVVGLVPWTGWDEQGRQRAQMYNNWIRSEAERRGLAVADLWASSVDLPDGLSSPDIPNPFPPDFRGDGFHPNDLGHQRIAATFLAAYHWYYERQGLVFFPNLQ